MHRPVARTLFILASFLPLAGIFAITAGIMVAANQPGAQSPDEVLRMFLAVVAAATLVAGIQIGLGIVVALHLTKRPDLSGVERAGWVMACLFAGSLALPLFSLLVLPRAQAVAGPGPVAPGR